MKHQLSNQCDCHLMIIWDSRGGELSERWGPGDYVMPGVSSGVRACPCDLDLAFVLPSPVPCLHRRTPLHSSPEYQLLQAGSLLNQSQEDNRCSRDCCWGLLFWPLSCRGKSWDSEFTPLERGQCSWVCRLRAPGLPSAAEWETSPGLHYSPALIRGPCCSGCWAWKVFMVESGRLKVNHSPQIPAPPTLSQKWRKWACCLEGKDGQTVRVGNDNSQAFNKDLHVGKFVYHCELDRFLILKDFLMRLAVMLTNVTSLMLYNEICQHLEDLCNSVN